MPVVALTEWKGELLTEAPHLAPLLGLSEYDVRARFAGAPPRILLQTADEEVARRVQRELASRGHGVLVCDASAVVHTAQMVKLHRFSLDPSGVWANGLSGDRLAWGDLGAVVVALVRTSLERTTDEVDFQGSAGRAPTKVTYQVTRTERAAGHFAYLFPKRSAASPRPWVLEEATAQYISLGANMQSTRRANFFATVAAMRRLAPHAAFDDRFVGSPLVSQAAVQVRGNDAAPPSVGLGVVDLTVHVLGEWLQRERTGGPYR